MIDHVAILSSLRGPEHVPCPACGSEHVTVYDDQGRHRPFGQCEHCDRTYSVIMETTPPMEDPTDRAPYEPPENLREALAEHAADTSTRGRDADSSESTSLTRHVWDGDAPNRLELHVEKDDERAVLEVRGASIDPHTALVERPIDQRDVFDLMERVRQSDTS